MLYAIYYTILLGDICYMLHTTHYYLGIGFYYYCSIKINVPFVDYYESLASMEAIQLQRQHYFYRSWVENGGTIYLPFVEAAVTAI